MTKILLVLHDSASTPGTTEEWCLYRGIKHEVVLAWQLDRVQDYTGAIFFGGDVEIWQTSAHPWLIEEKRFIAEAIEDPKSLFGICLGAQLIAEQLGSISQPTLQAEKGWLEKNCLFTNKLIKPLSWHSSAFSLPLGASLASGNSVNECSGFTFGTTIVGYQFHTEIDDSRLKEVLKRAAPSLDRNVQSINELLEASEEKILRLKKWYFGRLDAWYMECLKKTFGQL